MFVSATSSKLGSGVVTASSAKKSFLVTPFAPKAPHEPEPLWKYVVQAGSFNSRGSKKWNCSFCKADYVGSYSRVRAHLLGIKKQGIGLCLKATSEDKASMAREEHESSNNKEKESNVFPSQLKRKVHGQHSLESMFNASCRKEVDEADTAKRPLINFVVSSPRGPVFKGSVDTSGNQKTGEFIATTLKKIIMKVGPEHVVQFITDNAANCKLAGQLIELEFKHIFWTPCATHCLNLLLKDLMAIEWIADAITKGKEVQQFITNHDATRAMFGKRSKLKLVRPEKIRFASHFMMLHRLVRVKTALKHLVTCEEWEIWKSQNMDAKDIEKTILDSEFWDKIQRYVKVCWPVMAMLRMVDKNDACMGVMFEGMDQMVEKIKEILLEEVDGEAMFEEMNVYIQARWLIDSPLHATAFLLNPKWFPEAPHKDAEVMKGWRKTLDRVGRSLADKTQLKAELSKYIGLQDSFGESGALEDMEHLFPVAW
ncbi:hypothetical protein L7F22_008254 [Adiantum nelumboides]|nr:hypothetical protein [Adiantum nelumboides]